MSSQIAELTTSQIVDLASLLATTILLNISAAYFRVQRNVRTDIELSPIYIVLNILGKVCLGISAFKLGYYFF